MEQFNLYTSMICLLHHWPFIPYTIHIETNQKSLYGLIIDLILVRSATFSNISAMVWRLVLVVEEAGIHAENHRPWASNWKTLSFAAASRVHPFCNLQSRVTRS